MTDYAVVIPAGGSGQRMTGSSDASNTTLPKQFTRLAGRMVIEHAMHEFLNDKSCVQIVIPVAEHLKTEISKMLEHEKVDVVTGGETRVHSVLAGLLHLKQSFSDTEWVMVHDAARPNLYFSDIQALINAVSKHSQGAILACPSRNTLKLVNAGKSIKTLPRQDIWQALTPQVFNLGELCNALQHVIHNNIAISDEAAAMEYRQAGVI
ncbi:MAG: NTP transferase domain-containing protein, partial [Gammaproteobacteria bacterium]|nr:NTP transferase domain-containing protein [Gammaproteobacteria bacterium]